MARWQLSPQERENLRIRLGQLLIGPEYDSSRSLIEQILERVGGSGPTYQGPLMRLLAGQPKPQSKPEELYPMPSDYAGGIEEWAKLSLEEKKAIHEALKSGRKIYISKPTEETKRATLDNLTLEKQRIQRVLTTEW